ATVRAATPRPAQPAQQRPEKFSRQGGQEGDRPVGSGDRAPVVLHPRDPARTRQTKARCLMESKNLMMKWSRGRGWDERTREYLFYRFVDKLGIKTLELFDRFLALTAASEDEAWEEDE